ncbi:MAG TPA: glycosyltransferase 87 family protein [Verrucomicrobiae bacterium]|nr:glycosyltransferase 87 family protein [Verrucomicrobiae bacterium]
MKESLRAVLLPFAATRLALMLAGFLGAALLPSGLTLQHGNLVWHRPGPPLLEITARWDAEWYLLIAERGYGADEAFVGLPVHYEHGDDSGFFPLYPLLLRLVAKTGMSFLAAGALVSNLAALLAAALLLDIVKQDRGEDEARRAVWILLAFPTSFFLSAVYAESVLLAATLLAVRLARDGHPHSSGAAAALACLAKPTGVLALLPVLMEIQRPQGDWDRPRARVGRAAVACAAPALALAGWAAFCHDRFGEWLPFVARQERWRGATSGPWRAFARYFEAPQLHGAHRSTIDLACAVLFVVSLVFVVRRLRRSDALYAAAAILLPLSSTLWSFTRFASTIYPVSMLWARAGAEKPDRHTAIVAFCLPLAGFFAAFYAAWWWVG